jgi:hypothetical protein
MNFFIGLICFAAGAIYGLSPLTIVSFGVFIFAAARTILDYTLSDDFMFP